MPCLLTTLVFGLLVCISTVKSQNELSVATNKFSFQLLKVIFQEQGKENVISSPVSLSTLLSILLEGAADNTLKQLKDVLHLEPEEARKGFSQLIQNYKKLNDNTTLEYANGLFLSDQVKLVEDFKQVVQSDFLSEEYSVNFNDKQKAAETINSWASDNTHGLIPTLFEPDQIPDGTIFVLTNAIYFKSFWKSRFQKSATQQLPFYRLDGSQQQVSTMVHTASYKTGEIADLQSVWIEVPYEGSQFSFLVVMPTAVDGFDNLQQQFTDEHFSTILESLQSPYGGQKTILYMPKFELSTDLQELVETMKKLGLTDIFENNSRLPGITGDALKVDKIVQKAKIKVDEEGSEAAVVTGVIGVLYATSVDREFPPEFRVNRPFFIFVIDKTNSIPLFAGRVTDPAK